MRYRFISFLLIVLVIFFRYQNLKYRYSDGDYLRITTKILSEPIVFEKEQYLKLQSLKVYLPKYPEISYGDVVVIEGLVNKDKLINPKIIEIKESEGLLFGFREKLILFYKSNLPEPYGSLVAGIVIGSKNMPQSFWEKLKATGTAHVVVASGTNVTMMSAFLISILTILLKRRQAILITVLGIFAYVVISGFDAPIIRAAIMGIILLYGQEKGKIANVFRILVFTCLLMLFIKPLWITDLGFILSFVATISLMLMQKLIDSKLKLIPAFLREGFSTSLAAQIGVAPILFVTFGNFNLLSPVINALILWTIPYIMVLGSAAGLIGLIAPFIGRLMLFVLYPLLVWFVKTIEVFS